MVVFIKNVILSDANIALLSLRFLSIQINVNELLACNNNSISSESILYPQRQTDSHLFDRLNSGLTKLGYVAADYYKLIFAYVSAFHVYAKTLKRIASNIWNLLKEYLRLFSQIFFFAKSPKKSTFREKDSYFEITWQKSFLNSVILFIEIQRKCCFL